MKKIYGRLMLIVLISVMLFLYMLTIEARAANISHGNLRIIPQQEVRGVVSDQAGMPLPGVTVAVKDKNRGATTDIDGEYSIVIEPNDILIFSFVGFQTVEEPVDGRREVWITLEEDIGALGEVEINAGYYYTTKRESTGNISRVTAEEIELQPVVSPLQALQGRMAGVEIIPGGNQPGMAATIRIRGRNSIRNDGNFPLYIIDGVPINSTPIESNSLLGSTGIDPLNSLNLSNIESIEILKDADATAIYGSRGANGVVLITTKSGRNQAWGIEARAYTGAARAPNKLDLLNTEQYLQIRNVAFQNDGVEPNEQNAYDLLLWDNNRYTDWQDFFFGGTSPITNINLEGSGGNETTSFRIGGSFYSQGTIYPADYDYEKVTASLNLNHRSSDGKLEINLSANYGMDDNRLAGAGLGLNTNAFRIPPNAPAIFNEDGSLNWEDWGNAGLTNPMEGFFNSSRTESTNLVSNLGINYYLLPGLALKTNIGYTNFNGKELVKLPTRSYNPSDEVPHRSLFAQSGRKTWIIEPQLSYNKELGIGEINALIGATFQENQSDRLSLEGEGYVAEVLIGNLNAVESILNSTSGNTTYRYSAIFGRLGYNWQKKYFINLTGRRDGSSRFGAGRRFANFGAVGAAWIFTEEPFVKNTLGFLSFGKFRGSYGTTGNDQIGDYGYLDAYEATRGPGGLYPTQLANPDYSWEENKKLEAALELSFIRDRITLGISWYKNRSSNQLVGYNLPATTGFSSVQANLPATVENTGWEGEMSAFIINSENWRWQSSFNISIPRNELVSYPNIEQSSYNNTYRVGHPLDVALLFQYDGIDTQTGFYSIADVNEDGRFDYEDRVVTRNHGRQFFGGLSNNIRYKNMSLQFLWEFVKQEGAFFSLFDAGRPANQRAEVIQALDSGSRYQRISQSTQASTAYSYLLNTAFPYQDASFLRLRTLSISYAIPSIFLNSMGLKTGSIFLNGQNLFTLTEYNGMDPEMPYDGTSFAGLRTLTCGVQLNF